MILLFIASLTIIITTIFVYRNQNARKRLVPPGPPGLPLIGNLHQLMATPCTNIHLYLWQLSKRYGPLLHLKLGSIPLLIVSSAKSAEQVLKIQESYFCNRPKLLGQQKLSYNSMDIAFSPYGNHWREVRKITTIHLFSLRKIQSFRPIREDEVSRMVSRVSDLASSGETVNLSDVMGGFFIRLLCRIAFGKRYDEEGFEMRRFNELLREAQEMMSVFFVSDYIPLLGWVDKLSGLIQQLESVFVKLDMFYQELINEHLDPESEKKSDEESDILDVLIQLKQDNSCSIDLTWDCIKALLMNIFIAGIDTNTAAVIWTMTALMKAPRVLKKLQAEIRGKINRKPQVDEDDIQKFPYLKAVISESLRLYPPAPLLVQRESIDKCSLEAYEIQPKTLVYINAWAIGRDPEYWEKPHDFLPERFVNNDVTVKGQDFGVIPFGSGRRICPGISMGLVNIELMVANLVYHFDWEFPQGVSSHHINEDCLPGITMHKKDPLVLMPKKYGV